MSVPSWLNVFFCPRVRYIQNIKCNWFLLTVTQCYQRICESRVVILKFRQIATGVGWQIKIMTFVTLALHLWSQNMARKSISSVTDCSGVIVWIVNSWIPRRIRTSAHCRAQVHRSHRYRYGRRVQCSLVREKDGHREKRKAKKKKQYKKKKEKKKWRMKGTR